jgi:hypothetical protein
VSFKITGQFIAKVQANSESAAKTQALAEFMSACKRASQGSSVKMSVDPEIGAVDSAKAYDVALPKAGVPRVDWGAVEEMLSMIAGEFPHALEKEALAVIKAAVFVASQYPEDSNFVSALAKARNALVVQRASLHK